MACVAMPTKQKQYSSKATRERSLVAHPSTPARPVNKCSAACHLPPTSTEAFSATFYNSSLGRAIIASLSMPSPSSSISSPSTSSPCLLTSQRQIISSVHGLFASLFPLLRREVLIVRRNTPLILVRLLRTFFLALTTGCVFFQTGIRASPSTVLAALYTTVFVAVLLPTASIQSYLNALPLFEKQRQARYFNYFPALLVLTLIDLCVVATDALIFGATVYFCAGFYNEIGNSGQGEAQVRERSEHFLSFVLNLVALGWVMMALFRCIAYTCPSHLSPMVMTCVLVFGFMFSGFMIPRVVITGSFGWIIWANPIFYGYQGKLTSCCALLF